MVNSVINDASMNARTNAGLLPSASSFRVSLLLLLLLVVFGIVFLHIAQSNKKKSFPFCSWMKISDSRAPKKSSIPSKKKIRQAPFPICRFVYFSYKLFIIPVYKLSMAGPTKLFSSHHFCWKLVSHPHPFQEIIPPLIITGHKRVEE
jgi:hypothetical protein